MSTPTQYERYEILLDYLAEHLIDEISPEDIESVCFYSYRNINRIFAAMRNETIGQHIKRLRLEKAAEYLKYSNTRAADITFQVGYAIELLPFEIKKLPSLQVLCCQYEGSYKNKDAMLALWDELIVFAAKQNLHTSSTLYLGEILDDEKITDNIHCRYNAAITLPEHSSVKPSGKFKIKQIDTGTYARFLHTGSHESCDDTYDQIFSQWMHSVRLEFDDRAILEFYREDDNDRSDKHRDTEILIPVIHP